jgi:hypothetical protein
LYRIFLENVIATQTIKILPAFMESDSSSPSSKRPVIELYLDPIEFSPNIGTLLSSSASR